MTATAKVVSRLVALRVVPPRAGPHLGRDGQRGQGGVHRHQGKSSLGDALSSLGDAKSLLGDAKSSLGDAESSLGGR
jgi:hypothetical protein